MLVLHDPTTAIDAATEDRIAAGLDRHRAGRSTLLVTSSPALLSRCDRVVVVSGGAVTAEGTHASLIDDPRLPTGGAVVTVHPSARGQVTLLPIATARRTWQVSAGLLREHPVACWPARSVTLIASGVAVVFVPALLGRLVDAVRGPGGLAAGRPDRRRPAGRAAGPRRVHRGRPAAARPARRAGPGPAARTGGPPGPRHAAGHRGTGRHRRPGPAHRRRHHGDLRGLPHRHPRGGHRADRRRSDPGRADPARLAARPGRAGPDAHLDLGHPLVPPRLRSALRRRADRRRSPRPRAWSAA